LDAKGGVYGSDGVELLLKSRRCSVWHLCFCVWILFYCHFKSDFLPPPDLDLLAGVLDDFRSIFLRRNFQTIPSVLDMVFRFAWDPRLGGEIWEKIIAKSVLDSLTFGDFTEENGSVLRTLLPSIATSFGLATWKLVRDGICHSPTSSTPCCCFQNVSPKTATVTFSTVACLRISPASGIRRSARFFTLF
jgi:hypothetical protein